MLSNLLRIQRRHLPKAAFQLPTCLPHHRIFLPIPPKHFSTTSKHTAPIERQRAHASSEIIPGKTLYVSNLPKPYDAPEIKRLFDQFGKVEDITIKRGLHRNGYYACIRYGDTESSRRAFDASILNPFTLDFTELKVQISPPPYTSETIRVSTNISKRELQNIISSVPIVELTEYPTVPRRTTVVFASRRDRNAAFHAAEQLLAEGRIFAVSLNRSVPMGPLQNPDAERTLFIRDLDVSDRELSRLFKEYNVQSVTSRPPLPPVYYIQFDSVTTARQARRMLKEKGILSKYSSTNAPEPDTA